MNNSGIWHRTSIGNRKSRLKGRVRGILDITPRLEREACEDPGDDSDFPVPPEKDQQKDTGGSDGVVVCPPPYANGETGQVIQGPGYLR